MLCSPIISNVQVTKTLIDGGVGLSVLSVETFDSLQVPYDQLQPTKPFSEVTDGSTTPIGLVHLPVTFGERKNYRTELIDFDVAHIRLPYNAILGYPALSPLRRKRRGVLPRACLSSCSSRRPRQQGRGPS